MAPTLAAGLSPYLCLMHLPISQTVPSVQKPQQLALRFASKQTKYQCSIEFGKIHTLTAPWIRCEQLVSAWAQLQKIFVLFTCFALQCH